MDKGLQKIFAVAAVMILLTVSVGVLEYTKDEDALNTNPLGVISRVNTEGSSIFIADSELEHLSEEMTKKTGEKWNLRPGDSLEGVLYEMGPDGVAKGINPDLWEKNVVGTPGKPTIQHKMIESFVKDMGLEFRMLVQGEELRSGVVYYDATLTGTSYWTQSTAMTMGTVWQPVCGDIEAISDSEPRSATRIMSSAQMEPNHACCVIAGNVNYLDANADTVIRFLAGFVEAVDRVNDALDHKDTKTYADLVKLAVDKTQKKESVVKSAMDEVIYTYGNMIGTSDTLLNPLNSLREDVAKLSNNFNKDGTFTPNTTTDKLGFSSTMEFGNALVNDYYLSKAIELVQKVKEDPTVMDNYEHSSINVVVINGDIHQITLHYGIAMEIFEKYKITPNLSTAKNGGGIAKSILNGAADVGFLGLPPAVINAANNQLVKKTMSTISGTVLDENKDVIPGAKVVFKTNTGDEITALTDVNGRYTMNVVVGTVGVLSAGDVGQDIQRVSGPMRVNFEGVSI